MTDHLEVSEDYIMRHAARQRVRWIEALMRQLAPSELSHVALVEFADRPFYWELHCGGRLLGSFKITSALEPKP
jgi:hypothetical protein